VSEVPRRLAVGVFPASAHAGAPRLLSALEEAFPVRFEPRGEDELRDLDAILELGAEGEAERAAAAGVPALRLLAPEPSQSDEAAVQTLSSAAHLDRRLHSAELPDARLAAALGAAEQSSERAAVLAYCGDVPTWTQRGRLETALLFPAELKPEEALRERLCERRSAALLPLVHFLRELTAPEDWEPPAPRASLVFDDPNLHWPSYGFVDLAALGEHARTHGYHAGLAMVPLDTWYAHPRALRALRESRGALSLLIHGNDHYGGELGEPRNPGDALALAAQALRRVRSFERRTGAHVEPVMVPPHERCSAETVVALRRCGFEAITMTQPYPWLGDGGRSWLAHPPEAGPLVGWHPVDHAEGLPVLLRHPIVGRSLPEMALRAFLGQPLILYGHQNDLDEGLDVLAAAAADVERLGPARWCSLSEIAAAAREPTSEPSTPAADGVDPELVPPPRRRPLAVPRRLLSEGRDRLAPLLSRAP
jgi:hypothetical protein